jgi:hypothetical protein
LERGVNRFVVGRVERDREKEPERLQGVRVN